MKKIIILILLVTILSRAGNEFIRVNRIDSLPKGYVAGNISNISFSDFSNYELKIIKADGSELVYPLSRILDLTFTVESGIETQEIINKLGISLLRNYPNPFNPETTINFAIHDAGFTKVEIYNYQGQKVSTLHNGYLTPGSHSLKWSAKENNNSSGAYIVKVTQNNQVLSSKMLLIK